MKKITVALSRGNLEMMILGLREMISDSPDEDGNLAVLTFWVQDDFTVFGEGLLLEPEVYWTAQVALSDVPIDEQVEQTNLDNHPDLDIARAYLYYLIFGETRKSTGYGGVFRFTPN